MGANTERGGEQIESFLNLFSFLITFCFVRSSPLTDVKI